MPRGARPTASASHTAAAIMAVAIGSLILYAMWATQGYFLLLGSFGNSVVLNPPIRFYVGNAPIGIAGLSPVLVNETFCPESAAIRAQAAQLFSYPYYVQIQPGRIFNFSLTYNPSNATFLRATVMPPFRLVQYSTRIMQESHCVGYPNATGNFTISMSAPNSSYVGPLYAVLYFSKNS